MSSDSHRPPSRPYVEQPWPLLSDALDPIQPSVGARERLLAAVDRDARYLPFVEDIARCFDLSTDAARTLLASLRDPDALRGGVAPVLGTRGFRPGPAAQPLRAGILRMQRGTRIPAHRHIHREITFVLEGRVLDEGARTYGPGEWIEALAGSSHTLTFGDGEDALVAVLHGDIEFV